MLSKFGPESWAYWAVVSAFFTPRWLIAVLLNYRSLDHLNIKEIYRLKWYMSCFMKLRPENYSFTHFMLTHTCTCRMEFPILIFWMSSLPDPTPPWRLIWVCTVCQRPKKWRQGLNELNITSRVLEMTSRNFRKCKNLECNLYSVGTKIVLTRMYVPSWRM